MPPPLLIDLSGIDLTRVLYDVPAIEKVNPHRYEMRMLDGIVYWDPDTGVIVGFKDVTEDEFWVRGHIPGRPLFPGVLMIEAAAQLSSFAAVMDCGEERFIGFGGIEDVKFRNQVVPGQRLYILGKFLEKRVRRYKVACQGLVDGQLAFQCTVIGMPI
ncbi:MAG: beta-hydroxyacyl-ACP dehydratase [Sedimentisphaerales bacterium]|nr:beta-hydroxyacyl-ACP dehydratase [Sedimentisphaerales bacterium]